MTVSDSEPPGTAGALRGFTRDGEEMSAGARVRGSPASHLYTLSAAALVHPSTRRVSFLLGLCLGTCCRCWSRCVRE